MICIRTWLPTLALFLIFTPAFSQSPCSSTAHQQFDFWVGEWQVYHATADTIVGQNTIKKILNSCVIEENWTGKSGFSGKSFNTYNIQDSTWNQVWVDVGGNTYHFKGKYQADTMRLQGETMVKGKQVLFDMTYKWNKKEDTVRQTWKSSQDKGKTWTTIFDGIYKKE